MPSALSTKPRLFEVPDCHWIRNHCRIRSGNRLRDQNEVITNEIRCLSDTTKLLFDSKPFLPPTTTSFPESVDTEEVVASAFALSPRAVASNSPTETRKSIVALLAVAHWTYQLGKIFPGFPVCAQPRQILAGELSMQVREDRRTPERSKLAGYQIA